MKKNLVLLISRLSFLGASTLLIGLAPVLQADTRNLVHYNFTDGSLDSTIDVDGITAAAFDLGANGVVSSSTRMAFYTSTDVPANQAEALAPNNPDFFSFTVTVGSDYALDLTRISFSTLFDGPVGSSADANKTVNYLVQSSISGFGEDAPIIGLAVETFSGRVTSPTNSTRTVMYSLSGLEGSQSITAGEVEFRIYLYSNSTATTDEWIRIDNVTLTGNVNAIPEPAGTAMIIIGSVGLLLALRRRKLRSSIS